jgi:hypothetical protein
VRALASLLLLAACHNGPAQPGFSTDPGEGPTGPAASTDPSSSTSSTTSTSSSTSTSASGSAGESSTTQASVPDMGTTPDFGSHQPVGCKGKIDFIFAISDLFTMEQEEAALLASFDGFMKTVREDFADFDAHIIVPNVDGYWSGSACESNRCPEYYPHCGPDAEEYMCGSQGLVTLCETVMGAGVLFNAGPHATNYPCELAGGRRYIVVEEEPDLNEQFKCIASVGLFGADTPMMRAIAATVAPEINGEGGCNEGFLRPDALLVIVMVMDSADEKSIKTPAYWFEKVLAAKGGDLDAMVMAAIINPLPEDPPKADCAYDDGNPVINPLRIFAELFPHRAIGDVCGDSFAPTFAEAAALVKETCSAFIPQ